MGLLTDRACKTLAYYLMETNVLVYNWWMAYLQDNPILRQGDWDEICGDAFLRKLLSMNNAEIPWSLKNRPEIYNRTSLVEIKPRELATRVMDIRWALAADGASGVSIFE